MNQNTFEYAQCIPLCVDFTGLIQAAAINLSDDLNFLKD